MLYNLKYIFIAINEIISGTPIYQLWSHEWSKHGTCAAQLKQFNSEFNYFSMGMNWLKEYSMLNILKSKNIIPSNNILYSISDINDAIKANLGVDPAIECKKEDGENYISEIRICFTKDLEITNCDGVVTRQNIGGSSILTNCNPSKNIVYPHYKRNIMYVQLYKLISWLQWFTL